MQSIPKERCFHGKASSLLSLVYSQDKEQESHQQKPNMKQWERFPEKAQEKEKQMKQTCVPIQVLRKLKIEMGKLEYLPLSECISKAEGKESNFGDIHFWA